LSAVHELHKNDIVHGNLKLENVYIGNEFQLKLANFDHAKEVSTNKSLAVTSFSDIYEDE